MRPEDAKQRQAKRISRTLCAGVFQPVRRDVSSTVCDSQDSATRQRAAPLRCRCRPRATLLDSSDNPSGLADDARRNLEVICRTARNQTRRLPCEFVGSPSSVLRVGRFCRPRHRGGLQILPRLPVARLLAERVDHTLRTPFRSGHTCLPPVCHRVDVQRVPNRWWDHRLQWILGIFEAEPTFDDAEIVEQSHAVRVHGKNRSVEGIHHHASGRLEANTR